MFIDPGGFALIRVVSGAVALGMVLTVRGDEMSMRAGHALWAHCRFRSLSLFTTEYKTCFVLADIWRGSRIFEFFVILRLLSGSR